MASYPQTGSTLEYASGINKTSTAISTNILIAVRNPSTGGYVPVGAIQKMNIDEKREVKTIDEVGTDGHIDSVPTKSTDITGTCERIRFDKLRIAEAFDRSFMHVSSQVYPFDIIIYDKQKYNVNSQVSTVIKNVWINNISYVYDAQNWIITDHMGWVAETIYSTVNGGPAAVGGELNLQPFGINDPNWIERQADSGAMGRRGSLDAAGLIDIGSSNYGAIDTTGIF
jgi:hypothetical protein